MTVFTTPVIHFHPPKPGGFFLTDSHDPYNATFTI
jgi:hypothetical protein